MPCSEEDLYTQAMECVAKLANLLRQLHERSEAKDEDIQAREQRFLDVQDEKTAIEDRIAEMNEALEQHGL
jgi:hypothetical protein